jgi:hypothetical protein
VNSVVARFHHVSRDLDQIESDLLRAGAKDAQITGYTVVLTVSADSERSAAEMARQTLDQVGATDIKIRYARPSRGPRDAEADAETASLMAKIEMGVFGHP